MDEQTTSKITVRSEIMAPLAKVWEYYTSPEHIVGWNNPSDDWHTTKAENDLRAGGAFVSRMEAKDGSAGFDFGGTYDDVQPNESFSYTLGDGRKAAVTFTEEGENTVVEVVFDPENVNTPEFQRQGWQAILDNFKRYVESN